MFRVPPCRNWKSFPLSRPPLDYWFQGPLQQAPQGMAQAEQLASELCLELQTLLRDAQVCRSKTPACPLILPWHARLTLACPPHHVSTQKALDALGPLLRLHQDSSKRALEQQTRRAQQAEEQKTELQSLTQQQQTELQKKQEHIQASRSKAVACLVCLPLFRC